MLLRHRLFVSALWAWSISLGVACVGVHPIASGAQGGGGGFFSQGGAGSPSAEDAAASGSGGSPRPAVDARPERCDDAGHCACMNILSLGKVAHYGANSDSTDAFQQYLDTKSNARMTLLTDRTTLTPELLAGYDVLILQALEDNEYTGFWSYSQDEESLLWPLG